MIQIQKLSYDLCEEFVADGTFDQSEDNKQQIERLKLIMKKVINEELSPRQKELCYMYFYKKLDMPQIASILNINKSTVSRTLARAVKNINDKVKYYRLR